MPLLQPQELYQAVEKSIEAEKFAPLYFFYGDEPYLINQAMRYLKVCSLHGGAPDFNFSSFFAGEVELSRVRDEVETLPMMAPRRVIILKEVQDLTDKDWDILEPVISTPVDSSVFILVGGKIDKRRKIFKLLMEQAVTVEFKKPYENQISGWIRQIAKAHHLTLSEEAVLMLHKLVGNQLGEIEAELLKLSQYLGDKKEVSVEDVVQVVSKKKEESVFELVDALASGNKVKALHLLIQLLDQGQNEVGIVSLVARHIRILLALRMGMEQGLGGQKLAVHAGVPSYFLNEYVKQARAWTHKRLEAALVLLSETDRAIKSSPLSTHIWLENMIFQMPANSSDLRTLAQ